MKQLLIIRHAKSNWANAQEADIDRSLNERGNKDAPNMANRLIEKQIQLDAIVASTANRAFTTASYFAKAQAINKRDILCVEALYLAPAAEYFKQIQALNQHLQTVAIIGHNPGITDFVNALTTTQIDNMPTCGIFAIKINIENWKDFQTAKKEFWFFDSPKSIR